MILLRCMTPWYFCSDLTGEEWKGRGVDEKTRNLRYDTIFSCEKYCFGGGENCGVGYVLRLQLFVVWK